MVLAVTDFMGGEGAGQRPQSTREFSRKSKHRSHRCRVPACGAQEMFQVRGGGYEKGCMWERALFVWVKIRVRPLGHLQSDGTKVQSPSQT